MSQLDDFFASMGLFDLEGELSKAQTKITMDYLVSIKDDVEKLSRMIGHYLGKTLIGVSNSGAKDSIYGKICEFVGAYYEACGRFAMASDYYTNSGTEISKEKAARENDGEFDHYIKIDDKTELLKIVKKKFDVLIDWLYKQPSFVEIDPIKKFEELITKAKEICKNL